jgi:multiple sugar transport system substrate-binding protein
MAIGSASRIGRCCVGGLLFLMLCGCAKRPGLTFAAGGAPAELAVWEQIANSFERETGIRVALLRMPADSAQQRQALLIALKARQPDPDVFLMDVAWVGTWAAAGWLEPLPAPASGAFMPEVLQAADVFDHRLLALPVYLDAGLLYYRTDLLARSGLQNPPQTWRELLDSAVLVQNQLRDTDPAFYGFVWQGAQYEGLVVNFLEFAGAPGGFRTHGSTLRLDLPGNEQALSLMRDCIWNLRISPPNTYTEMREEQTRSYFQDGHALYERNWSYAWALHQSQGSKVRGRVGVTSLPGPAPGESAATLGGYHVGVSAFSDVPANARRFALYITSREVQKILTLKLGWNPGRSDLYEDPEILRRAPHLARLKNVFRTARPRPPVPDYTILSEQIQAPLNAVLSRRQSAEEGLRAAQAGMDRIEQRIARK